MKVDLVARPRPSGCSLRSVCGADVPAAPLTAGGSKVLGGFLVPDLEGVWQGLGPVLPNGQVSGCSDIVEVQHVIGCAV